MRFFIEATHRISRVLCIPARICVFSMMFLVVYGVMTRYFLRSPNPWAVEGSGFLLIGIVMLGVAYTQQVGGHVAIDSLVNRLSPKGSAYLDIVLSILTLCFCASLIYVGWDAFIRSFSQNWHSQDVNVILWPSYLLIPLGIFFLFLEYVSRIFENILRITKRNTSKQ